MKSSSLLPPWYKRPFFYLRWRMAIDFGLLFAAALVLSHVVRTVGIPLTPYHGWYGDQRAQMAKQLGLIADLKKERLLLWLEERKNDALVLSQEGPWEPSLRQLRERISHVIAEGESAERLDRDISEDKQYQAARKRLTAILTTHRFYENIHVVDPDTGLILISTDSREIGRTIPAPASFAPVINRSQEVVVSVALREATGKSIVSIASGIMGEGRSNGHGAPLLGLVVLEVDLDYLVEPLLRGGSDLGETGDIVLVDSNLRPIIPLRHQRTATGSGGPAQQSLAARPSRRAVSGKEGIVEADDYRGVPVIAACRSVEVSPGERWGLVVKVDRDEVFAGLWKRVLYSLAAGACGILCAGIAALFLARRISRPVESLRDTVREVQAGNMRVRSTVTSADEVGILVQAVNSMIQRIEHWHHELEQEVQSRTAELKAEITHRRQAEAEVLRQREILFITLRSIAEGVVSTDFEGKVVSFNAVAEELTGWTETEAMGKPLRDIFNLVQENTGVPCEDPVERVLTTGCTVRLTNHTAVIARDGTERIIAHSAGPIRNAGGAVVGTVLVFRDITDFNRTHEALERSEARFRQIYDDAPVIMHSMDTDGIIRNVNKRWLHALGYCREEVLGRNIELFLAAESAASVRTVLGRLRRDGEVREVRHRYIKHDRSAVEVTEDSVIIQDPAVGTLSVSTLRDVTHEVILQKQLLRAQKMEAVGTLAGGIAHDFNNLLQIIGAYAEVGLLSIGETGPGYTELAEIRNAALSGAELTQGLLTFSRKVESKLRELDVHALFEQTAKILRRTLPKMISLELELTDAPHTICGDAAQLQQVVMNLAVNARDAMPQGGRLLIQTRNTYIDADYCRSHVEATPGEYLVVSVIDSGAGMPRKIVEHIFEPFFTTKELGRGTGLGLSIVYGVVRSHGGHIQCYSEPGLGTTFLIYLPLACSPTYEPQAATNVESVAGGSESILLVDDEEAIRDTGQALLSIFGYTVITAANGYECLEIFARQEKKIDLIILDFVMPGMSGKECTSRILERDPDAKVILCSGYAPDWQLEGSGRGRAKAWLTKPYQTQEMLRIIRKVLDEP